MVLRQPIVAVLGHVDHGKTTLLDKIRGTTLAAREPGGVTQHIGATEVPLATIKKVCEALPGAARLTVPGLLFIDTPGHEAFTNLRSRGGALADIAVLVVDVREGFKPQTLESLKILRARKTPFVVALNKIDMLDAWRDHPGSAFVASFNEQLEAVQQGLDERIYRIIERFHEMGIPSDRYDRIADFRKTVALVPVAAKIGEGIPDLLLVLAGLAQRYLEEELRVGEGPARGTVLEVKHEKGIGTAMDSILVSGTLHEGDTLVVGGLDGAVETRVKGLQKPAALSEIRDPKRRFVSLKEVGAAAGVRVFIPDTEGVVPGALFRVANTPSEREEARREVQEESVPKIELQEQGIFIRADAIGSLEGLAFELRSKEVPVKSARVGAVTRKEVLDVALSPEPLHRAILAFSTDVLPDAKEAAHAADAAVIEGKVIYKVVEDYIEWRDARKKRALEDARKEVVFPAKFIALPDHTFRASKPAIFGVRVLAGRLRPGVRVLRNDGRVVGELKSIRTGEETIAEAWPGDEVAVAVDDVTMGRQLSEGDTLYMDMNETDARRLRGLDLSDDERAVLDEITKIKRKHEARFWGM
ncbi:MAG TPA: translation initiation factor IF-2 [Candidatus Thermoplasmatota archaeon]